MVSRDSLHAEVPGAQELGRAVSHFLLQSLQVVPALQMIAGEGVAQSILLPVADARIVAQARPSVAPVRWTNTAACRRGGRKEREPREKRRMHGDMAAATSFRMTRLQGDDALVPIQVSPI